MKFFQSKYDYLILSLGLLVLSIVIFFPVSSDLATFIHGGMILENGGKLFVDYFDVKPPFIYYFFEFLYSLFGKNITFYRLFDFIYQSLFLLSSIYILNRINIDKRVTRLFVIIMPIAYVTLSFPHTFQVESLLFLPLIWYFYLSNLSEKKLKYILLKGILLGIAINLKYTFGIILIADILYQIIQKKDFLRIVKESSVQFLVAITSTVFLFLPVLLSGNFSEFIDFFNYMKLYSNYPALNLIWVQDTIKFATSFFTENYTLILLLSAIYTVYYIGKKNETSINNPTNKGVLLFALVLFSSVVIERKMLIYHEQRTYPFLVLLSSIGLFLIIEEIKKYKKLILFLITFVAIFFSPIPRLVNILKFPIGVFTMGQKAFYSTLTEGQEGHILDKHYKVADYINSNSNTDRVLLINTGGNEMVCFFKFDYKYSFPQSAFYLNKKAPEYLKSKAFENIKDAEYIIIQNNDNSHIMFFNDETSLTSIQKNLVIWDYIESHFEQVELIENNFIIYKRTSIRIE
ncbi:MAG: glycosyltransferase family 39 protein [Ignavibacteriae bacterium]|nr:glycosyltransferase family 39 protein [Ignavibacteriota bacterium]MCB9221687.1 glycosyltransferase family 39 protein [Ignavibacteria bacterium]